MIKQSITHRKGICIRKPGFGPYEIESRLAFVNEKIWFITRQNGFPILFVDLVY